MQLFGTYEDPAEMRALKEINERWRRIYEELGSGDRLVLRTLPCGHYFHDQFKWEAYARLRGISVSPEAEPTWTPPCAQGGIGRHG